MYEDRTKAGPAFSVAHHVLFSSLLVPLLIRSVLARALSSSEQEAILDVNPDEAVDMAKKQRLLHWDSRKKKFVKTTLAELSERKTGGSRKIRTESGKGGEGEGGAARPGSRLPAWGIVGCLSACALRAAVRVPLRAPLTELSERRAEGWDLWKNRIPQAVMMWT